MRVGLTADFLNAAGKLTYRDIGLDILDQAGISHQFLAAHGPVMDPDDVAGYDAVIALAPQWTAASFAGAERLTAVLRFGVGYDQVDIAAATAADVLVCITAGAVNYTMAESVLTWMLALCHRVFLKDRLVREGRWGDKVDFMGSELREKTLGIVGCGGIGSTLVQMLAPFRMQQPLVFDPYLPPQRAAELGVRSVDLATLLAAADFVSINCPLTEETRGLIGAEQLALMKPAAFLINTARGEVVDEPALVAALRAGRIGGLATDVFDQEPADGSHPFATMDNVIVAPHAIGWTHELFREIGRAACRAAVVLGQGKLPDGAVNPEVAERAGFKSKLRALSG